MSWWRGLALCMSGCFAEAALPEPATTTGSEPEPSSSESSSSSGSSSSEAEASSAIGSVSSTSSSSGADGSTSTSTSTSTTTGELTCTPTTCETCENCSECRSCALEAVCDDENAECDADCQALVTCVDACELPECIIGCCCLHTTSWKPYNTLSSCLDGECQFCAPAACVTLKC